MLYQDIISSSVVAASKNPFTGINFLFRNLSPDTGIRTLYIQGRYSLPNLSNFPGARQSSFAAPCSEDLPMKKELFSTPGPACLLSGGLFSKWVLISKKVKIPVLTNATPVLTNVAPVLTNTTPVLTNVAPVLTNRTPVLTNVAPVMTNKTPVKTNKTPVLTNEAPVMTNKAPVKTGKSISGKINTHIPKRNEYYEKHA